MKNFFFTLVLVSSFLSAQENDLQEVKNQPVVILGGGVGALTSAIYLGRAGIEPVVIEGKNPGGAITQSHALQNWPGELEISGLELAERLKRQAEANGASVWAYEVVKVDLKNSPYSLTVRCNQTGKETIIRANFLIIAMGATPNFLHVPGEQEYWGKGVSNCAACDGSLYRDQVVGVVGGGDGAVLEADYLSNLARQVHVFVRKDAFKGGEVVRLSHLLKKENVEVHFNTTIEEVLGDGEKVEKVTIKSKNGKSSVLLDGLFLGIGSTPNTQVFKDQLELDAYGYIVLKQGQETSAPHVYAIGDIADPIYKQAVSAASDGAKAALQIAQSATKLNEQNLAKQKILPKESLESVIEIKSREQFQSELANSDVPIFVDFYASWCGPCKKISPLIEGSAETLSGKVKFLKINVDQFSDLSQKFQIRAMPTALMLDADGQVTDRKVGSEEIAVLLKNLESRDTVSNGR